MILRRTSLAAARVVPWANGRGVTRELLREEGTDGRLILRLSVADVVEPGPFSPLPGIDRLLTLIEGPGFDLSIDGRAVAVRPLDPIAFAGEAVVAATAVPGPSRDFNVMTDRRVFRAAVAVRIGGFTFDAAARFLFVVAGRFSLGSEALDVGDLVDVQPSPGGATAVEGAGAVLVVSLSPA